MKTIIHEKFFFLFCLVLTFESCNNIPKDDIYKEFQIRNSYQNKAGQKEGDRELNDQVYLDLYLPDYTKEKGEEVCEFYDKFFKKSANEVNDRLTINVDIWSSGVGRNELENPKLQKYYRGGLIHNYKNDEREMNLDNAETKLKEPDTIKYYQKQIIKEGNNEAIKENRFMMAFVYDDVLQDTLKAVELYREFLDLYPQNDKMGESARMILMMYEQKMKK